MKRDDIDLNGFSVYLEKSKPRQSSTVKGYLKAVRTFRAWVRDQHLALEDLELTHLETYLETKRASPTYRNFLLGALRIWFDYLIEEGQISHNPARSLKRSTLSSTRVPAAPLNEAEVQRLRHAIAHHSRRFECARNRAILALLLDAGLSTQELCSLQMSDLANHDEGFTIRVRGIKGKERSVVLKEETSQSLKTWLEDRKFIAESIEVMHAQLAFFEFEGFPNVEGFKVRRPPKAGLWPVPKNRKPGWPLSDQGVRAMLKRFGALAKIHPRVTPQRLRKTFLHGTSGHSPISA